MFLWLVVEDSSFEFITSFVCVSLLLDPPRGRGCCEALSARLCCGCIEGHEVMLLNVGFFLVVEDVKFSFAENTVYLDVVL